MLRRIRNTGRLILALATFLSPLAAVFTAPLAPLFAAEIPSVSITPVPDNTPFVGTTQAFDLTFVNGGDATGYGPFATLELPVGLNYTNASYLSTSISPISPTPVTCSGSSFTNPLTSQATACISGTQVLVFQYPFGSFTVGQPAATIRINASVVNSATLVGRPLTVTVGGGFIYGNSPTGSTPTTSTLQSTTVTPVLYRLTKTYIGPENETATGPNFPRSFLIAAEIAPGQVISNFRITDTLPNNIVISSTTGFVYSPVGGSLSVNPITGTPATSNTFTALWTSVSGGAGPGTGLVTLQFPFYVTRTNSLSNSVVDPTSGAWGTSPNTAASGGFWSQGGIMVTSNQPTETLTDKPLAIQKGVASSSGTNLPGTTLTYTLNFQVSDFFTVGDIVITDTFDNAQDYVYGSPRLWVSDRNAAISNVAFPVTNTTVISESNGSITLIYNVSAAMLALGQADGVLQGGLITSTNYGATTGALTFQTTVRDIYRPGGVQTGPLQPNDSATNDVTIGGSIRNNALITQTTGYRTDTSGASVLIQPGQLIKSIYAINGNTTVPSPVMVKPDDAVTYRLQYVIPIGDFSALNIIDYLPLPVFTATVMTYNDAISTTGTAPAIGEWTYGAGSLTSIPRLPAGAAVTVTASSTANSIEWDFGARSDTTNQSTSVDLLFTVRASNEPMADGLFLTNQARTRQTNSVGFTTVADDIVQIQILEPLVTLRKGVLGVFDGPGNADPYAPRLNIGYAPTASLPLTMTYSPAAACDVQFSGPVTSSLLSATPKYFDADASGADAGDRVTFAIVAHNTGSAPAHDVTISDTLPAGLQLVPGSMCIRDGSGAPLTATAATSASLFSTGLVLSNTLAAGRTRSSEALTNATGSNIAIITFDAIVLTGTTSSSGHVNASSLLTYTNSPGNDNMLIFTPAADRSDTASVTLVSPQQGKLLVSTEISVTGNTSAQVTIGELITYSLVITVPEGATSNLVLTDAMDANSGLAFVDCVAVSASSGVTSTIGAFSNACLDGSTVGSNPLVTSTGRSVVWNLGSLLNTDVDNGVTETVRITYTAVSRNISTNAHGDTLVNRVSATYGLTNSLATINAPSVGVVEPSLSQSKRNTPATGDAGDTITYTVIVTNAAGRAPAYDVVITDVFPSKLMYTPSSFVIAPTATVVSSTYGITASLPVITPGTSVYMTFTGVLSESVNPTELIVNNAYAGSTSMPDLAGTARSSYDITNTVERSDNSAGTIYDTSAASNASVVPMTLGKLLVSTEISATGNTNTQATVGELITYTLVLTVPEGTSTNVRITDTMDSNNGLAFVDCVDISAAASISSTIGAISAACADGTAGGNNPLISNTGRTAAWNLGTLVNTDTDDAVTETVRITYTAVVRNIATNVNAATRTNRASGTYGSSNTLAQVSAATLTLVEPNLSQSKANTPQSGDAGDTITYTIVVTNASGRAPVYDLVITDAIPAKIIYTPGSFVVTPAATVISTTGMITATFAEIAPGSTARITFTGVLSEAVNPNELITNSTLVSGTSMPGLAGVARSTYDITNTVERSANSSNSTYTTNAAASMQIPLPTLGKVLVGTEISATGNDGTTQATVAELITYTLVLTVPEGTTTNVRITDTLDVDADLAFVDCVDVTASAGVSSSQGAINTLCNDGTGGGNNPIIAADGAAAYWNLGTLTNSNTDNAVAETVRITYTVLPRNVGTTVHSVTAMINRASGTYGITNTLAQVSAATVTVVEPNLSQSKANTPLTGDAFDTITYTIVVTNASGRAPAYDVVITDVFPSKLVFNPDSFTSTPDATVISTTAGLTATFAVITPGTTARITFTGSLSGTVIPAEVITNTTGVVGTSLPGLAGVTRSSYSPYSSERISNSGNSTYVASASSSMSIIQPLLAKSFVRSELSGSANGPTQTVIGEMITYTLVLSVPEGMMPVARITDTLPTGLAYVRCDDISASAGVTTSVAGGFAGVCNGTTAPTVSAPGQTVVFDMGILTNTVSSNSVSETVVITYAAIVLNVAGNQTGTQLSNSAQYGWNGRALTAVRAISVTVIEPAMGVIKTVNPASPATADSGDTITYTVVITGSSGTDAYDVQLYDALPSTGAGSLILSPTIASVVASPNTPIIDSSNFTVTGSAAAGYVLSSAAPFDLTQNASRRITVTLTGVLPSYVNPGSTFTNTATVSYTSLSGQSLGARSTFNTNSTERDGSGGVNDYTTNNATPLNITQVDTRKSIVLTSEDATGTGVDGNPRVAVGEIVQYRVFITMSEGTASNIAIYDNLPTGMTYITGSARVGFVASYGSGAGITSTAINTALPGCSALEITAGDIGSVPTSQITCPVPGNLVTLDGNGDPTVSFGTVANFDTDVDAEYLVLELQAVIQNIAGNTAGTTRANQATTLINGTSVSASPLVTVTVAEPSLSFSKSALAPQPLDAGDLVTFTMIYTAATGTSRMPAFDAVITDVLDSNLALQTVSLNAPTPATLYNSGVNTIVTDTSHLTVTVAQLDPGGVVTVTAIARLVDTTSAGRRITNTGYLAYTSLPTDTGTISGTFAGAPGASGTITGERTGAGGAVNTYAANSTVNFTATTPSIVKATPTPTAYGIGQPIVYTLTVTLPEGVATNVSVLDDMPSGLVYMSSQVVTLASASGGLLSADYDGTIVGPTVTNPNGDALFAFGNITTTADNSSANNVFLIRVTARIDNLVANQVSGGTSSFQNTARLTYTHPISGVTGLTNGPRTVTLIEPLITASKRVTPVSGVQSGTVLTYVVTLTNTGNSVAYDTTFTDTLPAGLADATVVAVTLDNATDSASLTGSMPNLSFGEWDIAINSVLRVTYTVRATDAITVDGAFTNTVDADWSSADGVVANERTYNDGTVYTYDGTQDTATAMFTTGGVTVSKSDGGTTSATIGTVIRYTVTFTAPLGTVRNLAITDTLPTGLSYLGNASLGANVSPGISPTLSGQNVIWSFGNAVITPTNAVTLAFDALVSNVASNVSGVVRTNYVTLTHNAVTGTLRSTSANDGFTITEPIEVISKRVTPTSGVQAGDTLTYVVTLTNTGTSVAYDTTLTDTLPAGVGLATVITAALNNAPVAITMTGSAPNLTFGTWDVPVSGVLRITYTVQALDTLNADGTFTNTADADWSSQSGSVANERIYDDNPVNTSDGSGDTATARFTTGLLTFSKTDGGVTTATVGTLIRYTLTVTAPLGTVRNLVVTDTLPTGLDYVGNAALGANISPAIAPAVAGQNVAWNFGDAVITPTNTVTMAFDARVSGLAGNISGATRINTGTLTYNSVTGTLRTLTSTDGVTLQEPIIVISKRVTPASGLQSGDTLTYVIVLTNTGTSMAYDTTLTDTLPNGVASAALVASTLNGVPAATSLSGSAPNIDFGTWDVPVSGVLRITYTVRATDALVADGAFTNTADADWTSMPGVDANERIYNDNPANTNDGTGDTATAVFTTGSLTFSKSDGGRTTVAVGEVVRYTLTLTAPLGTVRNLIVSDTLPAGMTYAGNAALGANISPSISPTLSGQRVVWNFGDAVITPTNVVTMAFDAFVSSDIGNVNGVTHTNVATLTYSTVTGTLRTITSTDPVTLLEPTLIISKRVTPASGLQSGDTLTYVVTLTNTGTAVAYDTILTDTLPVGVGAAAIVNAALNGSTTGITMTDSGQDLTFGAWTIPVSGVLVVTYTVQANDQLVVDGAFTNTADADWTSLPGNDPNERIYNDNPANANDGTGDTATAVFTTARPTFSKTDGGVTTASVGDTVRYTLTLTSPLGVVRGLRVTDTLPSGMTYAGNTSMGSNISVQPTPSVSGQDVVWSFGDALITPTGVVTIAFDALVTNSVLNTNGVLLTNIATLTHNSLTGTVRTLTGSDSLSVLEPVIALAKRVTPTSGVQAGDTLTYVVTLTNTGTATAYEVSITDTLPYGVADATLLEMRLNGVLQPGILSGTVPNISVLEWDIPVNGVLAVTYTVRATSAITVDGQFINTADADWTSVNGASADERIYNDNPIYTSDGTQDTASAVFTTPGLTFSKTDGGLTDVNVGAIVRYTLTFTSPLGTISSLLIGDTLPDAMSFAGNVATSANITPVVAPSLIGQSVVWPFSNVVISPTNAVTIAFDARIDSTYTNTVNGAVLTNTANLQYQDITGTLHVLSSTDNLTLTEPTLIISKQAQPARTPLGGTDLVTYTILLTNTGNATAYDVAIVDAHPAGVFFNSTTQFSVTNSTSVNYIDLLGAPSHTWTVAVLNPGSVVTLTYSAIISRSVPAQTTLTNTVYAVYGSQPSVITSTRTYTTSPATASVVTGLPELGVTKSTAQGSIAPDGLLTYTIRVTNSGIVQATGVVLTDVVPVSTTFDSSSPSVTPVGGVLTWTIGTLDIGEATSVTLVVRADASMRNGANIINTAVITNGNGGVITPTATVTTPVTSAHALALSKVVAPQIAAPGDIVTYTLYYTVTGNEPALGVLITDVLPAGVTLLGSAPAVSSQVGQTAGWSLGTLAPQANAPVAGSIVFSAQLTAAPTLSGTTYVNVASIGDTDGLTDTDTATVTVNSAHALEIVKTVDQTVVTAGTQLTYTLVYSVTGNEPSVGTTVADVLPPGVSLASTQPAASSSTSSSASWSLGTLSPLSTGVITVVVDVAANVPTGTLLVNTASISDTQGLTTTSSATSTVTALAEPTITKFGGPNPVVSGGVVTYTLVFTNNGPSDAQNVVITDVLPADVTWNGGFTASVPATRTSSAPLAWAIGTLPNGGSGTIVFTGTVSTSADTSIVNTTVITTSTPDRDPNNNTSSVILDVNYTDVYVLKSVEPATPVLPGDTITWTIRYGNIGIATARDVYMTDTLPSGITWGGAYTSTDVLVFTPALPELRWQMGDLASGASGEIVFTTTANVTTTQYAAFTNTVVIGSSTPQTNTLNDSAQAVTGKLDLLISKVAARSVITIGEYVSFTIVLTNAGGVSLTALPVTDIYDPTVLEFVSAQPAETGTTTNTIAWNNLAPVAAGQVVTLEVTFRALTTTNGGNTTNSVIAIGSNVSVTLPPVQAQAQVRVLAPQLAVLKLSGSGGAPVPAGSVLTYTILITNSGDGAATNVTIFDSLLLETVGLGSSYLQPPALTIPAGTTYTLDYPFTTPVPVTNGVQLQNTVSITSTEQPDPQTSVVTDTLSSTHTLSLSKVAERATAQPGEFITYTVAYTVSGTEPVTGVTVVDPLPPFVSYVSSNPAGAYDAGARLVTWTITDPLVHLSGITLHTGSFEVVVQADIPLNNGLQLVNTAVATDTGGLTASSTATVTIVSSSTLAISKAVQQTLVQPGELLTYTLAYTVQGNTMTPNVVITDALPAWLSYVSAEPPATVNGSALNWTIGNVPTYTTGIVTLTLQLANSVPVTLTQAPNTAVIGDGDGRVFTSTVSVPLPTDVAVAKSVQPQVAQVGDTVTYVITVTNLGPVLAQGVLLSDPIPAGLTPLSTGAGCTLTPSLACTIGDLAVGASVQVTVAARIATASGLITNTASVTSTTTDVNPANNQASAVVDVHAPVLVLNKTSHLGDGNVVDLRGYLTYTLVLVNIGDLPAAGAAIMDQVPTGTTYVAGTAVPAAQVSGNMLTWQVGALPVGAAYTVSFMVYVDAVNPDLAIRNRAFATGTNVTTTISSNPIVNPYSPSSIALSRFTAQWTGGATVAVNFQTSLETNTSGFYMLRATTNDRAGATRVSGFLPALGAGGNYDWVDSDVAAGTTYYYWIEEIETNGASRFYGPAVAGPPLTRRNVYLPIVIAAAQ